MADGAIPDPNFGQNERDLQWVGRTGWVFEREFFLDEAFLDHRSIALNAKVLDTMATVHINGREVAQSRSAFVPLQIEVREFLRLGKNSIRITFESPEASAICEARKYPRDIPFMKFPVQSPHRNLLRKNQSHAGWDWGPCLTTSGITDEISLSAANKGRIQGIYTVQNHLGDHVRLAVICDYHAEAATDSLLEVDFDGQTVRQQVRLHAGLNRLTLPLTVPTPRLWWPNGYGKPHLYDLALRVGEDENRLRIGLRTIEIVSEEDEIGRSFYFKVNGVPIFSKGANWIPADALPGRITRETLDDLLSSAVGANMNMIRVWGGGQYEPDVFYDLCDEKGLLVWQDFMFSCACYPASSDFLNLVRKEAVAQIKRLRNHASLALWCGDNENLGAVRWFSGHSAAKRDRNLADWAVLNKGVLREAVEEHDPERDFWPSSPCGGPDDFTDCWREDSRGDMHYWDVWLESASYRKYEQISPRFCSEFGHQAFPSMDLVTRFVNPGHINITAPEFEFHQRDKNGNSRLMAALFRHFRHARGFEEMLYVSQVSQGLAIETAVEHFRRLKPRCMGALYWQFNDVWPAISWSSLEYGGKWKLLHHMARRFFAPILVSARETNDGQVEIWLSNDLPEPVPGVLEIRFIHFNGGMLHRDTVECTADPDKAACIRKYRIGDLLPKATEGFLALSFTAGRQTFENTHLFAPPKMCDFADAEIRAKVDAAGGRFAVRLETDFPAFWCSVEARGIRGEFSENAFSLLPGEPKTIIFNGKELFTPDAFRQSLKVIHIRDSYHEAKGYVSGARLFTE